MDQPAAEPSVLSDFELAAQACGHDPGTAVGASDARADHRVWDLLDHIDDIVRIAHEQNVEYRSREESIAVARRAIDTSGAVSW